MLGAYNGRFKIVKLLLEKGADVHAQNDEALIASCTYKHIEVVKLLLNKGSDIHADYDLALCCFSENEEMVKFLLEKGANKNKARCLMQ